MPAEDGQGVCPVCRHAVDTLAGEACARCGTVHHRECLLYAGRCAVFGCEPGRATPVKKAVRREIPVSEQFARCMLHASPVFGLVALLVILDLNSTGTTLSPGRQPRGGTRSACVARASAFVAPPSPHTRPNTASVVASPRPPEPRRPAFACPAASPYDERWHPWKREVLERIVVSDPQVAAENAKMLRGRTRRLIGMCLDSDGSTAYLCYGSPADLTSGCEQRIVVRMRLDQTGRTLPVVTLVESTATSGAPATWPEGELGVEASPSPGPRTRGTMRQTREDDDFLIRRPNRWPPSRLVAPETLLSP